VAVVVGILAWVLAMPSSVVAQNRPGRVLDWETGENRSYLWPALEIPLFILGLNVFNRNFIDDKDYDTDLESIWKNLRTTPDLDRDPFRINQLGHPYQGSIYYGAARSAGLSYWESLLYTLAGSFIWETAGETTRPSINDHVATGIGGTFLGEALFRMSSLLLESGGGTPGFWRELGAAVISPPTGFNRLVFGERFTPVLPSRDPAVFMRLRVGATLTSDVENRGVSLDVQEREGSADFSLIYGLPKPGYRYTRPFDFFLFNFTVIPNADDPLNLVENITVQGLLLGREHEWGNTYRGVWGLFGGYDYLSPQIFRLSTTNVSLGTVGRWWISPRVMLQAIVLTGIGFGAAGTVAEREERDYHYGVIPQLIVGGQLMLGDRVTLELYGRQYYVIGEGEGPGVEGRVDLDLVSRANAALTVRLVGPHSIGAQYVVSIRDARLSGPPDRQQSIQTVGLFYSYVYHGAPR
jgi:hypothetical protein